MFVAFVTAGVVVSRLILLLLFVAFVVVVAAAVSMDFFIRRSCHFLCTAWPVLFISSSSVFLSSTTPLILCFIVHIVHVVAVAAVAVDIAIIVP